MRINRCRIKDIILLIAVTKEGRHKVKIASSLWVSIISFEITTELLAMTDGLINREMGRDGGFVAIPSHLSYRCRPPVIARRYDEAIFTTINYSYYLNCSCYLNINVRLFCTLHFPPRALAAFQTARMGIGTGVFHQASGTYPEITFITNVPVKGLG